MEQINHPEAQVGEVFFTNASGRQFKLMRWKSKRIGTVTYDIDGNEQKFRNWFPVFVRKEELDTVKADLVAERRTWRQLMDQFDYPIK